MRVRPQPGAENAWITSPLGGIVAEELLGPLARNQNITATSPRRPYLNGCDLARGR